MEGNKRMTKIAINLDKNCQVFNIILRKINIQKLARKLHIIKLQIKSF